MLHRIVRPGILSLIGTISPVAILVWLITLPPISSSGSEASPYIVVFFIGGLALLSWVWLLAWSIVLLVDATHRMLWGFIVAASYAITFVPLFGISSSILSGSTIGSLGWFLGLVGSSAQVLGLVGGVWGIFWKTRRTPREVGEVAVGPAGNVTVGRVETSWTAEEVREIIVGPAGRVMAGGMVTFFFWMIIPYATGIILLLPPLLFGVLAVIMHKIPSRQRAAGIGVLVLAGLQILFLYVFLYQLFNSGEPLDWALSQLAPYVIAGVGIGLGISGAVSAIRRGKSRPHLTAGVEHRRK